MPQKMLFMPDKVACFIKNNYYVKKIGNIYIEKVQEPPVFSTVTMQLTELYKKNCQANHFLYLF